MAKPAEPGRTALLDAGTALADQGGLRALSVNAVVTSAGMAKGSFYQHFSSRQAFIAALYNRYHDRITEIVLASIADLPPGADRLRIGTEAFLDTCLAVKGAKAFFAQARTEADLLDEVAERNAHATAIAAADLTALGWPDPLATAHLMVAMIADISLQELYEGGRRGDLRAALYALVHV